VQPSVLIRNRRGQSGLWSSAISGDLPIVLVQIKNQANIELVRHLVQAHAYWRSKGLVVDLVIWNEEHNGYRQALQELILRLISSATGNHTMDRPGGIFLRQSDQISTEDRMLFQAVARIILNDSHGTLIEKINRRDQAEIRMLRLMPNTASGTSRTTMAGKAPLSSVANEYSIFLDEKLVLPNGIGGFSSNGEEYVITSSQTKNTPAPWVNVMANPRFGTVISENGQAYTWGENAHEFRLTPWSNDPVSDRSGEAFYLRDEETGHYWSPMPLPCRGRGIYVTRHGFGYSKFQHVEDGIDSEMCVFVAIDVPIKYSVLRVRNNSQKKRKLSATGYVEWVLGDQRPKSAMHVVTEIEPTTNTLCARNPYNTDFQQRTAFFDLDSSKRTISGDRNEFIGRNRSLQNPAAMERKCLSGKIGAGLDPCAAIQSQFELAPGEQRELVYMLGMAESRQSDICQLVQNQRGAIAAHNALKAVRAYWHQTLGVIQIKTPEPALNVITNGWLMYQTIVCRVWARSGYYQSGGAYGFRDQLQDTLALIHTQPQILREQLLLCAAHQFVEGDVQHWWHPPTGRGVRTRCSDDYLWLPLAAYRYVSSTGDSGILNEMVGYIEGRPVNPHEDSYYDLPHISTQITSVYEHCKRAIERGLQFGGHGLSLIGSCDWNDGMDKVGEHGKGESVWLSFFLYEVLMSFSEVASIFKDSSFCSRCKTEAAKLQTNIEEQAWDGEWYRRAYFDDGTPVGSRQNLECQIDSISQSWSVLSGAGDRNRSETAMHAVNRRLVNDDEALIQLLDPAFDKSDQYPGYIRGYVPGVRENGGQYTHAAIWVAMAFVKMGGASNIQRAWELMRMINPVNHGNSAERIAKYKVEPYVIAADVYAVFPHVGRGGWTWYTGSSSWMYRLIIESLLGLKLEQGRLVLTPTLPNDWPSCDIDYRHGETIYKITVKKTDLQMLAGEVHIEVSLDGVPQADCSITLLDDKIEHEVIVLLRT
jgi:cyclic beta-1,2-glucan synthetase